MSTQSPDARPRFSILPPPPPPVPPGERRRALALVGTFTASVFLSAFLLFLVQPLFGRMVLPLLGGSPAVWNTCMLFFQAALLGGYAYAHFSTQRLGVRAQAITHLVLLGLTALLLPISVAGRAPQGEDAPIPWLLGTMLVTVGPPFFVLAGTGPLLQRWFSHSGHKHAGDPYPLYAASNLGSMMSLLAYPTLMEPRMRLAAQSATWAVGFVALGALIAGCAVWLRRAPAAQPSAAAAAVPERAGPTGAVSGRERAWWVYLAFVPSTLLLGLTTYITTDLSPVPLLWVVPLALYLLTFTLAFARRPPLPHAHMTWMQPVLLSAVALLLVLGGAFGQSVNMVPIHLAGLFVTAMVCHGELARRRPPVRYLTEFYLWISVGGALGGVFNVLIAPVIFNNIYEYSIAIVLAALARPWPGRETPRELAWGLGRAVVYAAALLYVAGNLKEMPEWLAAALILSALGAITLGLARKPLWLAVCLAIILAWSTRDALSERRVLLSERSFFGRFQITETRDREFHVMRHGSTLHGAQIRTEAERRIPMTYYVRHGPVGQIFAGTADLAGRRKVAVVGLGTGTTAAYAEAGEEWSFYEIDPHVVKMATDPKYFSYYSDSPARMRVVLGDARLSMARDRQPLYDLIMLDAFSSDAIPVHLLTLQAMDTYLSRLAPGGVLAIHISNRYLDLEPVVASLVKARGLAARVSSGPSGMRAQYESTATWIAVGRTEEDLRIISADSRWKPLGAPLPRPWTDDYSSLLSVFSW